MKTQTAKAVALLCGCAVIAAAAPFTAAADEHRIMTDEQYLEEIHYYVIAPCKQ